MSEEELLREEWEDRVTARLGPPAGTLNIITAPEPPHTLYEDILRAKEELFLMDAALPVAFMNKQPETATEIAMKSPFPIRMIESKIELYEMVQVRTHHKRRINKKWAKRYGFRKQEYALLIDPAKTFPRNILGEFTLESHCD